MPMRLHFLSLVLLSCISPSSFTTTNFDSTVDRFVACRPHQIQALTEFKNEFDTRHCNHSDPFNGVWCDNSTNVITKLQLRACLGGTLNPNSSLFRLHHLRHLELSQNNFISSSLPLEFGNLNMLKVLSLSSNGFIGQVPSFSNISLLAMLDLSNNDFIGTFPLLQNLTKLSFLNLSNNHFSGTLDPDNSLFELHNLGYLNLDYNNFISSLPLEFGNLNKLEVLSLSYNGFLGQVPPTISNVTHLTLLHLDQNKLTGSLTFVQNLTKLYDLVLSYNSFYGTIPSLLTFTSLSYLDVRDNHLTGSIVFPNSSSFSKLESVLLGDNPFDGKLLEHISKLINLKQLHLSFLNISYPVGLSLFSSLKSLSHLALSGNSISPSSLGSHSDISPNLEMLFLSSCGISEFPNNLHILRKLEIIDLSNNIIKGKVPVWLWNLPSLSVVTITNNSFDGFEGAAEVRLNSSVKLLFLNQNCFEGEIPIIPLSVNIFSAWDNRFTGSIPLSICDYKLLTDLTLAYNNLTGPVPQCLCNLTHVDLRNNNLEGNIPDEFYAGAPLQSLDVGYNQLTGKLPLSLLNCSFLQFLSVDNNKIEDTFPFYLKALPELQVLTLGSNQFYGPISPPDQGPLGFPELRILEISDNKFTGSLLPSYFLNWKASSLTMNEDRSLYMEYNTDGYVIRAYTYKDFIDLKYKGQSMKQANILTSYASIDFSGNKLEGQIPESIGFLKSLIALNLSNNAFTGHIPLSLANLSELESLDLSRNQLSGIIPSGLGSLSFLAYINVSHNQLEGVIPQGTQITGQPISSFEGNARLCGLPLKESCLGSNALPSKQPKEEGHEEEVLNWKAVAIGYGPGLLLGLAITQVIASYKWSSSSR